MNTSSVAKQLGVSSSTVKRWVKQLKLNLEKNDMGHFTYQQEDIDLLMTYKEQQNEALLVYNEIAAGKDHLRRGSVHTSIVDENTVLLNRIKCLESIVQSKADQVVEYQILQHRREMEEMQATLENHHVTSSYISLHPNEINFIRKLLNRKEFCRKNTGFFTSRS